MLSGQACCHRRLPFNDKALALQQGHLLVVVYCTTTKLSQCRFVKPFMINLLQIGIKYIVLQLVPHLLFPNFP